jgi:two-component system nitrate/nitrite response regulator NarL
MLIVDDHAMISEILCDHFRSDPECDLCYAVPDIASAFEHLVREALDIVLLDYDLSSQSAFAFLERLEENRLTVPVLVISAGINHIAVRRLMAMGVAGIVWKTAALKDFAECVREVARGGTWRNSDCLVRALHGTPRHLPPWAVPFSERQALVLRGIAAGYANKEIAARLGVSEASVKCTVQQIFDKTGVRSRSELIRVVLERFPQQFVDTLSASAAAGGQ